MLAKLEFQIGFLERTRMTQRGSSANAWTTRIRDSQSSNNASLVRYKTHVPPTPILRNNHIPITPIRFQALINLGPKGFLHETLISLTLFLGIGQVVPVIPSVGVDVLVETEHDWDIVGSGGNNELLEMGYCIGFDQI